MHYYLGIDNGGTMTKAALFDRTGRQIFSASENTPLLTPKEGYNERDMDLLWQATARAVRRAVEGAGVDPGNIAGVGCTGHGKGLYLWGKDNRPAYHAIASTDHRAAGYVAQWQADGTAAKAREKTLQNVVDCQPVALLRWMKEHRPEVYENIQYIFEAKDFIRFCLTGQARAERTDYSGTSLLNLITGEFDRELLDLFDLRECYDALPPLAYSFEPCGTVCHEAAVQTGLKEGTPVCGGMFDIDACAIAMDVREESRLCVITGTWSINEYPSKTPIDPVGSTLNSLFCIPGYYLIEESSPTSAGNLEWVAEMLLGQERVQAQQTGQSVYAWIDREAERAGFEADGPLFLPFLYGTNCAVSRGAFLGLSNAYTKGTLLRAVLEGVAFSHLTHIQRLLKYRQPPHAVRIAGGAVNSAIWLQIFADVLGLPLEVVETKELGALGAAMAAAVCAGDYQDYAAAADAMVTVRTTILPDVQRQALYAQKYQRYQRMTQALASAEG